MKIIKGIGRFFSSLLHFIYYFRRIFMAAPVVYAAIELAKRNMAELPLQVGLILGKQGTYELLLPRTEAVYFPLALTGVCILCMFLSRKAFYPWLISVVTLAVPPLLLLLNTLFY